MVEAMTQNADGSLDEANWKSLATAGMLGLSLMHPNVGQGMQKLKQGFNTARQAVTQAAAPRHIDMEDPDKPLESEKDLSAWEYAEKKSNERGATAKKLAPFVKKFITEPSERERAR